MSKAIEAVVLNAATEFNETSDYKISVDQGGQALLYGAGGVLNSIALVTFIVMVEEAIESIYDKSIILANEKSMSQKNSPFLTIGTLANYCTLLLAEETNNE